MLRSRLHVPRVDPARLLLLAAALLFVAHVLTWRTYLLDDAYISLRYARNLVEGHGLVFNPGEAVEGYTNFLWVLAGAALLVPGGDAMALLKVVSLLAALTLLWTLGRLQRLGGEPGALPAAVWLLPLPAFGYWSTTGMETMLFAALLTGAVTVGLAESRDGRWRGSVVLFLLLALTRPEGVLLFGLSTLVLAAVEHRRRGGRRGWRRRAVDAAGLALGYGLYTAWRLATYGELLPNTYHAKVTGGAEQLTNGLLGLSQWALAQPVFAAALVAPIALLFSRRLRTAGAPAAVARPETLALAAISWGYVAYVVAVGGDFMPFFRFFLPILPLLAVLLAWLLPAVVGGGPRRIAWVAGLLLVQLAAGLASEEPVRAFVAHRTTVVGQQVGAYLKNRLEPGDRIAVNTAGSLPYESGLPTIDMLGLTDAAIARHPVYVISPRWAGHRRGWGESVLARRPRVVVWYNTAGLREPHYLGDHQLAEHPYFRFFYQLKQTRLDPSAAADRPITRLLGTPFGEAGGVSANLGARFEVRRFPAPWTVAYRAPVTLHYFELRGDHETLWPLTTLAGDDVDRFLNAVTAVWRGSLPAPSTVDAAARREVERLCDLAYESIERGDRDTAKELLSRAAERNAAARSPRVYQYVTNLAALEGDLFLAVHAQREALRLDPESVLYRRNLRALLTVPFEDFGAV